MFNKLALTAGLVAAALGGINAANATTQHGLVEQYAVSWPVVLLK